MSAVGLFQQSSAPSVCEDWRDAGRDRVRHVRMHIDARNAQTNKK